MVVLLGAYVPAPPLHVALVAEPPKDPANVTVEPLQMVCAGPALAVAAWLIVIVTVEVAAGQGPTGSLVVNVKVTVPAVTSPALGV